MAKTSQARIKASGRYKVKTYETISFSSPREIGLNGILDQAAHKAGTSKAAYIQGAIMERLHRDGFSVPGSDTVEGGCAEGGNAEGEIGGSMQGTE